MEDGETNNSTDEFEVVEMFRVDAGVRINLEGIIVVGGVLEQAIERIEHFVREKEKEFAEKNG